MALRILQGNHGCTRGCTCAHGWPAVDDCHVGPSSCSACWMLSQRSDCSNLFAGCFSSGRKTQQAFLVGCRKADIVSDPLAGGHWQQDVDPYVSPRTKQRTQTQQAHQKGPPELRHSAPAGSINHARVCDRYRSGSQPWKPQLASSKNKSCFC